MLYTLLQLYHLSSNGFSDEDFYFPSYFEIHRSYTLKAAIKILGLGS